MDENEVLQSTEVFRPIANTVEHKILKSTVTAACTNGAIVRDCGVGTKASIVWKASGCPLCNSVPKALGFSNNDKNNKIQHAFVNAACAKNTVIWSCGVDTKAGIMRTQLSTKCVGLQRQ